MDGNERVNTTYFLTNRFSFVVDSTLFNTLRQTIIQLKEKHQTISFLL